MYICTKVPVKYKQFVHHLRNSFLVFYFISTHIPVPTRTNRIEVALTAGHIMVHETLITRKLGVLIMIYK